MIAKAEEFHVNVLARYYSETSLHDHYRLMPGLRGPWEVAHVDLQ